MLLTFNHDALKFFKNWELLVSRIDLGVALFFAGQKTYFFEALQLTLNVAWIFFY